MLESPNNSLDRINYVKALDIVFGDNKPSTMTYLDMMPIINERLMLKVFNEL